MPNQTKLLQAIRKNNISGHLSEDTRLWEKEGVTTPEELEFHLKLQEVVETHSRMGLATSVTLLRKLEISDLRERLGYLKDTVAFYIKCVLQTPGDTKPQNPLTGGYVEAKWEEAKKSYLTPGSPRKNHNFNLALKKQASAQ